MPSSDYQDIITTILRWIGALRPLFACSHIPVSDNCFEASSQVHKDLLHYVQTVLGDPAPEEFIRWLNEGESSEVETFLEFLLFPDAVLKEALEPLLDVPVSSEGVTQIVSALEESSAVFTLLLADSEEEELRVTLSIPEWMWGGMVGRLQLNADVGQDVFGLITDMVPVELRAAARVLLRSKRWFTGDKSSLGLLKRGYVYRFLLLFPASFPSYLSALSLWLERLEELSADDLVLPYLSDTGTLASSSSLDMSALRLALAGSAQDEAVWLAMVGRQRQLAKALRGVWDFAEKLKRYNMETLMMQGAVASYVSEDAAREELRLIQRISLAVLGRPAAEGEEVAELLLTLLAEEPEGAGVLLRLHSFVE